MVTTTACTLNCPDTCSLLVEIDSHDKIRIRGNPTHPVTRGFTCAKVRRYPRRLRHPRRLTSPLRRRGNTWEEISWEAALALCVQRLQQCRSEPATILHIQGSGLKGLLAEAVAAFFAALGASTTAGSLCDGAGIAACIQDFGSLDHNDIGDLANARKIVNWGKDLTRSSVHVAALVRRARRAGATVLTISPGGDGHQSWSDHHIRLRPGTDRFLAAAAIKRLLSRGAISPQAIAAAGNWEQFTHLLRRYSQEQLLASCGVRASQLDRLCRYYEPPGPTATLMGWALQRYQYGGENVRFINALAMLTGNIGVAGGGSYFNISSGRNFDLSWLPQSTHPPRRRFLLPFIGAELASEPQPPINLVWINGANIVNQAPCSALTRRALLDVDFVVVVDAFMTDTAACGDLILPCALMLEKEDVVGSYLHDYVHYVQPVFSPPAGIPDDYGLVRTLASRLDPPVSLPSRRQFFDRCLDSPWLRSDLAHLRQVGFLRASRPPIAYEGLKFRHPDGRCRLPAALHPEPPPPPGYPLRLLTLNRRLYIHSQILPEEQAPCPTVWVAAEILRGLENLEPGRHAWLVSPQGRLRVRVGLLPGLHPEAVVYRRGDWLQCGGGINQLIGPLGTDLGDTAAFCAQYVRLQPEPP